MGGILGARFPGTPVQSSPFVCLWDQGLSVEDPGGLSTQL